MSIGDVVDEVESGGFHYEVLQTGAGAFDLHASADEWSYAGRVNRIDWRVPHYRPFDVGIALSRYGSPSAHARVVKGLRVFEGGEWEAIVPTYPAEDLLGVFSSYIDAVSALIGEHQRKMFANTENALLRLTSEDSKQR